MPILCCYAKKRRAGNQATKSLEQNKRNIFGMTLARLDEFESLTPLIVTPNGSDEVYLSRNHRITSAALSQSPPPPRRQTNGKTFIVPLNSGKGRTPFLPLLGTPESKVLSNDNGSTYACSIIVEDDENVATITNFDKIDADFISIDRVCAASTMSSYLEPKQQRLSKPTCNAAKQEKTSSSQISTNEISLHAALSSQSSQIPLKQESSVISKISSADNDKDENSKSNDSLNSFGSPEDSSYSTGSPLDTSASISDSFCAANEGENKSEEKQRFYCFDNEGKIKGLQQQIDMEIYGFSMQLNQCTSELDSQHKYFLHRIEEEPELNDDYDAVGMVTSRTLDSIKSNLTYSNKVDSQCNVIIPRSISQQFELMNRF